jgi:uncharacterized membrane protein YdjX (TVP38/TMEM64 family)
VDERSALPTALVALAVVGGLVAGLVLGPLSDASSLALHGDLAGLRKELDSEGAIAALALVGLALVHVLIPFPMELPTAAAGFALGFWVGFPLMLVAWVLSALVSYWLAHAAGRPVVRRVAGAHRLARAEALVARRGPRTLLALRLIPLMPFVLVCFACGLTRVPLGRYTWTTAVGTIPLTALTVLLGSRLQTPSADDPVLWIVFVGLLALLASVPLARRLAGAQTPRSGG